MLIELLHHVMSLLCFQETHFLFYKRGAHGSEGVDDRVALHGTVAVSLHSTIVHTIIKTYVSIDIAKIYILKI